MLGDFADAECRGLHSSCWQMLQPEVFHRLPQVLRCSCAFADTVRTHRVGDLIEDFAFFDEFVDQHFAVLVVYVVVTCAMDEEQVAFQPFGPVDRRTVFITFRVILWCVHVALLIDSVVESLVCNKCYCYACLEDFGVAEHAVECLAAAAAPACDADALRVDEWKLTGHVENALGLVFAGEGAYLAIDALAPLSSAGGCCTTVLYADDDVAEAGKILMPCAA